MAHSFHHIPFYKQMIGLLQNALQMLDDEGREEVLQFVLAQQNADGGFQDRGGRSDLYYSLFGGLILRAAETEYRSLSTKQSKGEPLSEREAVEGSFHLTTESLLNLKQFISRLSTIKVSGFIERCCLMLLRKELKTNLYLQINGVFSLSHSFWTERYSINLSYRSFVLFLTLDAIFHYPFALKQASKKMLAHAILDEHSPCSEVAAMVFLKKMTNQEGLAEQELLKSFACQSGGFRAFLHLTQADMLSTAVALFALDYAGCDLRLLKPNCLDFIQQSYCQGAFLSGDGDQTTDVEYTFYGLLALGVLAG